MGTRFILRPRDGVTITHQDGVYLHRVGDKVEMILVGPQSTPEELAAELRDETHETYRVDSITPLPASKPEHEDAVLARGFVQIILSIQDEDGV